jgi:hypothetical protein
VHLLNLEGKEMFQKQNEYSITIVNLDWSKNCCTEKTDIKVYVDFTFKYFIN